MLGIPKEMINQFKLQLRDVLPSRFKVDAWSTDTGAKFWQCEIRVGKDLYWGEFEISLISSPYLMDVLVRGIKGHMPGDHCGT